METFCFSTPIGPAGWEATTSGGPGAADGWGKPFNLGPKINSEFNEFNPDPTPDGKRLIFATNRKAARREQYEAWRSTIRETVSSDYDLWIADVERIAAPTTQPTTRSSDNDGTAYALALGLAREIPGINTPYSEGASCMSPAGDFLYFASNRPGEAGSLTCGAAACRAISSAPPRTSARPSTRRRTRPIRPWRSTASGWSSAPTGPAPTGGITCWPPTRARCIPSDGRPFPHLGWSAWLLIASILILVPLLMFLRGWKTIGSASCNGLLLSLLVHALITFALSFVVVSQNVTHYVRKEMGLEVPVNLKDAPALEEGLAIRSQASGDLPTGAAAAPVMLAPSNLPSELAAAPTVAELKTPGRGSRPIR